MTAHNPSQLQLTESLEADILARTRAGLSAVLVFVEHLTSLYGAIQQQYMRHAGSNTLTPEQSVLLQATITCRHQFVLGILTLLRGHLGDSFGYLRKALEFTLFAASVLEKPGTAIKWLNAGLSARDWETYAESFKIRNMTHPKLERRQKYWSNLIDDLPKLDLVITAYGESSMRLHATVLAAGPDQQAEKLVYYDAYVDYLVLEEPRRLVEPYFFMLWKHLDMLDVHARVLLRRSGIAFHEASWLSIFDPIDKNIHASLDMWNKSQQQVDPASSDIP